MQIKKGDNKMAGNKHDNGVHEVGTPETLKAYQEDTPNQSVEKYLAGIQEVIQEKKNKQKKSFMKVFQNPLKGFPYNEELDDNFVKPLEESEEVELEETTDREIKAIQKLSKDMQSVLKGYQNATKLGDKELKDVKHNDTYKAVLTARDKILTLIGTLQTDKLLRGEELEEGKMSDLLIDIQQGATAKELARDWPITIQQAKEFLKDYYSQKKGGRREENEKLIDTEEAFSTKQKSGKEIARKMLKIKSMKGFAKKISQVSKVSAADLDKILPDYVSGGDIGALFEGKNLMPDIQKIVDTKSASKVGGIMVDMFTASMIAQIYDKVNDTNKSKMEKSNISTLVDIAQRIMQKSENDPTVKEETLNERSMKMKDIVRKHKRELQKVQRSGNLELSKKLEDDLMQWAMDHGEVNTDDPDDFIDWLDRDLDDIMKGKIKESINEGTWALPKTSKQKKELKDLLKKPVILGKEGDDAADKLYDLIGDDGLFDDLYTAGKKNPKGDARPIIKAKMKELGIKEGKMDGSKLTGQEISVYFRRNKVRDKTVRKAVEIALDHGGAMTYAVKQIEKLKRGLSKNKDVEKALNYANFGEQIRLPEVGFMFKEDSPVAGDIKLEGDPYLPQKKGINKNIEKYWKKEIKGISKKELEAVQSMYMITDHSGVVAMYKASKRNFIKSLKD